MGGRGGTSGLSKEPQGRKMSIKNFLENLSKNSQQGMLNALQKSNLDVKDAIFTKNGNAVKSQEAVLESGGNRISVRFHNQWEPTQSSKPSKAIKQTIEAVSYENGNVKAIRTLSEKKSTSLKNAEKNYKEILEQWKKLTKQKGIRFK